jgi:protease-4
MTPLVRRPTARCGFGAWLLAAGLGLTGCTSPGGGDDFLTTVLKGPKTKIEAQSFLELRLDGPLSEGPDSNPFAALGASGARSLWDMRRAILAAAKDQRIVGMKLEIESPELGFGSLQELSGLLDEFRATGKPIFAYLRNDFVGDADYFMAVAANRIYVAPASALFVNGLRAEVTFWRGTLEKLHIVPHVLMFKEYKSAGEPFARSNMSEAFRESLTAVLSDLEGQLCARISQRRGLPLVQVQAGLNMGMMTTGEALQTGWVDGLGYRDAIERAAKVARYEGVEVKKYLRAIEDPQPAFKGFDLKSLGGGGDGQPTVALVFGEGPIVAAEEGNPLEALFGGETVIRGLKVAKAIDEAAEQTDVTAIVFRVNSPGGSAVGSDHVHDAIRRARDRGKKVVVSMGDVAASGGYWVSMGADSIVAHPTTITGSIGVVMTQFDLRGFYDWIGAHVDTVTISQRSGMFSTVEDFDKEREGRWTAWMSAVYEDFKKQVATGRKLSMDQVESLARGRIWSGTDAREHKLVDALGGLSTAIEVAGKLSGAKDPANLRIEIYPKKNAVEELFSALMAGASAVPAPASAMPLPALDARLLRELARPHLMVMVPSIHID